MTERRWHFDQNRFFIDAVSHCGNCYQGNVTTDHKVQFNGANQLFVTNLNAQAKRGVSGRYHRVEITDALVSELGRLEQSKDEGESFKGRTVQRAIEHFEILSEQ